MDKNQKIKIVVMLSLLFILGVIFYKYYVMGDKQNANDGSDNIVVSIQKIEPQTITLSKEYVGKVTPINSVSVLPFISGFIDKVLVSGGQNVKIGDVLFIIRQAKYKAAVDSAYANVLEAKANLENAKTFYERMKDAGSKAVSKTEIDNAKTAYLSAEASLTSAVSNYDLSRINYDYTIIASPINGVVGDVAITNGDYVAPNKTPLVKIIQFNPIRVVFSIADKEYISEIKQNPQNIFKNWIVKLRLSNGVIYDEVGKIRFLDNEVSSDTSSVKVYADFANPNKVLIANAYVDVIMEKHLKDAILIPQSAVYFKPEGTFVYVLKDDKAEKIFVEIGQTIENNFVIENGLNEDDEVILNTLSDMDLKKNIYAKEEE
ncbi:MAG: efflux RND transporter periplasmic adaptor subunit [Alphaproteobacteria bacterium]|nr:efflux RND transporter periplasmic adaptor subunit [Alphaproteobacteria bacterium]